MSCPKTTPVIRRWQGIDFCRQRCDHASAPLRIIRAGLPGLRNARQQCRVDCHIIARSTVYHQMRCWREGEVMNKDQEKLHNSSTGKTPDALILCQACKRGTLHFTSSGTRRSTLLTHACGMPGRPLTMAALPTRGKSPSARQRMSLLRPSVHHSLHGYTS